MVAFKTTIFTIDSILLDKKSVNLCVPNTYELIGEDDRINVLNLPPVPGRNVTCQIVKPDGTTIDFEGVHTFSPEQVEWFKAGSALNIVRAKVAGGR